MTKPSLIIADASIVLAYILNEPLHQKQLNLLFGRIQMGEHQLVAPQLLHSEICNRLSRIPDFAIEDIQNALAAYIIISLPESVTTLALQLTRTFSKIVWYDAIYHALALELGGTLITADKEYYKISKQKGRILFIADYK